MRIISIGDSNAAGQSFVAEAARILQCEIIDLGHPGDGVRDVSARASHSVLSGDLAVLLVGTNDLPNVNRLNFAEFHRLYLGILHQFRVRCDRLIACTLPPYASGGQSETIRALNSEIRKASAALGVEIFDLYGVMCSADGNPSFSRDYTDGVHFSPFGRARAGLALAMQIIGSEDPVEKADRQRARSLAVPSPFREGLIYWKVPLFSKFAQQLEASRLVRLGFDEKYYLEKNPDVAMAGAEPVAHFVRVGRREGRLFRFRA